MGEHIERFKVSDRNGMIGPKDKTWSVTSLYIPKRGYWYFVEEARIIVRQAVVQVISEQNEILDPESDEYKMVLAKIVALRLKQ